MNKLQRILTISCGALLLAACEDGSDRDDSGFDTETGTSMDEGSEAGEGAVTVTDSASASASQGGTGDEGDEGTTSGGDAGDTTGDGEDGGETTSDPSGGEETGSTEGMTGGMASSSGTSGGTDGTTGDASSSSGTDGTTGDAGSSSGSTGTTGVVEPLPCTDHVLPTELPASVGPFSTADAGDDHQPPADCATQPQPVADLVFEFTAPATDVYIFDTTDSAIDTVLYTLDGCDGEVLTCVDDISQDNRLSYNVVPMVEGETVLLVVEGFSETGDVVLNVAPWVDPETAYGDCVNEAPETACGAWETCVTGGGGSVGVCTYQDCTVPEHCPPAPGTGDAEPTCTDLIGGDFGQCYLGCDESTTCPDGMGCNLGIGICLFSAEG